MISDQINNDLAKLISEAKDKNVCTSLAVFKPSEILDLKVEPVSREWDKNKLAKLKQLNLFDKPSSEGKFEVVRKLPYKFSYILIDSKRKKSQMMIEDWEIGQLYWNCLAKYEGDETRALADVRKKYIEDFAKTKDLYLFLGTSKAHHHVSRNPFMIIGIFHPKIEIQGSLFPL